MSTKLQIEQLVQSKLLNVQVLTFNPKKRILLMFFNNTSTLRALSKLRTWTGTFTVHRLHDKEKNKIYFQHLVYIYIYIYKIYMVLEYDISAKGGGSWCRSHSKSK